MQGSGTTRLKLFLSRIIDLDFILDHAKTLIIPLHFLTMSLSIPQASQAGLFKSGYTSYDAEDGAVIRNVRLFCPQTNLS